ncbi:farnesol dehydrogenase-like [Chironomus tepperi]|uniref:farnesol dehydrogenase-like n=1 Tax=Chironomus tepperi TaxID=113505 RepID=UPI00391F630F
MDKWVGKIAVVTGASSGIGAAITKDLAQHGLIVIGLARRAEKIDEIAAEVSSAPGKIHSCKCDIGDLNSIKAAFKWIEEKFQKVHILVNNAGLTYLGDILDPSQDQTDKINQIINVNFTGLVHTTREAFRLMQVADDYGMIINNSSILDSVTPFPTKALVYPATKHAIRALTEIVRQELIVGNNDKIRVTNLSPGIVETNIMSATGFENADLFFKSVPCLQPKDVSDSVLYLLSTPYNVNVTQLTIKPVGEKF